jgi:hypothetical protein
MLPAYWSFCSHLSYRSHCLDLTVVIWFSNSPKVQSDVGNLHMTKRNYKVLSLNKKGEMKVKWEHLPNKCKELSSHSSNAKKKKKSIVKYSERNHIHITFIILYYCNGSVLLLVIAVNILLCLIHKLNLTIRMYVCIGKNLAYIHTCSSVLLTPLVHFALVTFEMVSHKLFTWAGLKPLSSHSHPPLISQWN